MKIYQSLDPLGRTTCEGFVDLTLAQGLKLPPAC